MAYDNIKILCQGFAWADSVPLEKCNFFSSETRTPFTQEIDLMDFVVRGGLGKIEFSMDDAENENGIKSLFYTTSNLQLKLSGIKPVNSRTTLKEFFEITSDVSERHSYLVRVYYNNDLLYRGTVYQDGLRMPFNISNDSEIISCLIIGFENEMKTHFSNENIIDDNTLYWINIAGTIDVRRFHVLLETNFQNPFITGYEYEPDIIEWYSARHPRFIQRSDIGFWHNRQGYERLKWNNSKWNWFISTINCMGWIFFIYRDKLYIKNRSSHTAPLIDVNFEDIANGYELGKRKPNAEFDYIMLIDGAYYGGDAAFFGNPMIPGINNERPFKGERPVILTNKVNLHLNTAHFSSVNGSNGSGYSLNNGISYRFSKFRTENDSRFWMYNIYHTGSGFNFGADIVEIEQDKILRLNGGSSSNNWWRVRLDQGIDSAFDNAANFPPTMPNQMEFTGCAGSALIKRNPLNGNLLMENYEMYVQSARFRNNYAKYLGTKSSIFMSTKLSYILTNPLVDFRFVNSGEAFFDSSRFSITSMKIDLENEATELDLIKNRVL